MLLKLPIIEEMNRRKNFKKRSIMEVTVVMNKDTTNTGPDIMVVINTDITIHTNMYSFLDITSLHILLL